MPISINASPRKQARRLVDAATILRRLSEEARALEPGDIEAAQRLFGELCNAAECWYREYQDS